MGFKIVSRYKSNKGIRLTQLSKQYFVPHWPKSGGVKKNCPPTFKTVAPPLRMSVCPVTRRYSVETVTRPQTFSPRIYHQSHHSSFCTPNGVAIFRIAGQTYVSQSQIKKNIGLITPYSIETKLRGGALSRSLNVGVSRARCPCCSPPAPSLFYNRRALPPGEQTHIESH